MLDLRLIRRDPDAVRAALARRGDADRLDEVLDLDEDWRASTASAERLRAEQKAASEAIAAAKRSGEDAGDVLGRMRDVSAQVKALTEQARTASVSRRMSLRSSMGRGPKAYGWALGLLFCSATGADRWPAGVPAYLERNAATSCASFPTTMFSGMIAPE